MFNEIYPKKYFDIEEEKFKSMAGDVIIRQAGEMSDRMKVKRLLLGDQYKTHELIKSARKKFNKNKNTKCFTDEEIKEILTTKDDLKRRLLQ